MVQNANCATSDNRNRKASPRQVSPAPSNSSAGSASSRASTPTRTVRFQDQAESRSTGNQGYAASGRGRWQSNQPPSGNRDNQRPWVGPRSQGQRPPSPRPSSPNQGGPRPVPPRSERRWAAGRGAPPLRPPAPPNPGNWRPDWRSPTGGGNRLPPAQPQSAPAPRRWLRNNGCYVCGQPGCHSDFHGPDAVSPQAPPGLQCFVCGRWGCHSSCHSIGVPPQVPSTQGQAPGPPQRTAPVAANQQSNWQRGSTQGERVPPAPPRPQSN